MIKLVLLAATALAVTPARCAATAPMWPPNGGDVPANFSAPIEPTPITTSAK